MYGKSNPAVRGCLRDDMLDGPEELYTLDAYSRLSNYFGDTEDTRLVGGSFAHYSRCGTVVRRFL